MKVVPGMVMRNVADESFLIPTGDLAQKYNGLITLNAVSALVYEMLAKECSYSDLLTAILNEFDVEEIRAKKDLDDLLLKLEKMNLLIK